MTSLIQPSPTSLLLLSLRRRAELPRHAAHVPLSPELAAVITADAHELSVTDLGLAGLSERAAWERASANLMSLAGSSEGLRFYTRRRGEALEIAVDGAEASAWLAHPRTFTVLDRHLGELLDTDSPVFALLDDGRLLAAPDTASADAACPGALLVAWRRGFPQLES